MGGLVWRVGFCGFLKVLFGAGVLDSRFRGNDKESGNEKGGGNGKGEMITCFRVFKIVNQAKRFAHYRRP